MVLGFSLRILVKIHTVFCDFFYFQDLTDGVQWSRFFPSENKRNLYFLNENSIFPISAWKIAFIWKSNLQWQGLGGKQMLPNIFSFQICMVFSENFSEPRILNVALDQKILQNLI